MVNLYCFDDLIKSKYEILIYGAGDTAKKIVADLQNKGISISFVVVSSMKENPKILSGIPVKKIDCFIHNLNQYLVIVGTSLQYHYEIISLLQCFGFKNIGIYDQAGRDYWGGIQESQEKYPELLADWYKRRVGESIDWNHLVTYNEKIQWLKLFDNTMIKSVLADKYRVRQFVKEVVGDSYLIPLYGVWNRFDEIDFSKLPQAFVLKCNHGSGWNAIVQNKNKTDINTLRERFNQWMSLNFAFLNGLELQYQKIPRKIIAEKFLFMEDGSDIKDYKLHVFDGKVKLIQVDLERNIQHKRNLYTRTWKYIPYSIGYPSSPQDLEDAPFCLPELITVAEKLASGFMYVRVDLYIWREKIYFGEMTFTHGSGTEEFAPKEFGEKVGSWINIKGV